jgi:hypothetical protein
MEGLRTWVIFSWLAGVIGDPMSSQQFDKLHSKRVFFLRAYEVGGGLLRQTDEVLWVHQKAEAGQSAT